MLPVYECMHLRMRMPIWGDADPHSHAWKCCWAAVEQQEKLVPLSVELKEKYDVEIGVRMGINSGFVSAGNMGSTQKMQYTVMGDAVNQAARFEPACKIFGVLIMIGESTYEMASDKIEARKLGLLVAKGKKQGQGSKSEPFHYINRATQKARCPEACRSQRAKTT